MLAWGFPEGPADVARRAADVDPVRRLTLSQHAVRPQRYPGNTIVMSNERQPLVRPLKNPRLPRVGESGGRVGPSPPRSSACASARGLPSVIRPTLTPGTIGPSPSQMPPGVAAEISNATTNNMAIAERRNPTRTSRNMLAFTCFAALRHANPQPCGQVSTFVPLTRQW